MTNEVGMTAAVTAVTSSLSASALWGIFTEIVPILNIVILFALGYSLVMRLVNRMKKHK